MKKTLLALSLLAGFAGVASAQSSVTLFGVVDANFRQIDNGSTKVRQLGTDGLSSSRLGFRGVEDLGGGYKAGFWLEAALNPDDGTINSSGKFWHRRSTVSLESPFGEIRLGRDYAPTYTGISDFDAFGDNGVGKFSNLQSKLTGTVNTNSRVDNQVQYFLPKGLGGVYGTLAAAPGEGVVAGNKYVGGRLGYLGNGLNLSVSYGETDATAAADKYKLATLGAAYDFGVLRVLGSFTQIELLSREEQLITLGATVPVGPGVIRASVGRADLSGGAAGSTTADNADATLVALGYVHNLSKRTALYGTYSQISNKGAQNLAVGATTPALAGGQKSRGIELGLRHAF